MARSKFRCRRRKQIARNLDARELFARLAILRSAIAACSSRKAPGRPSPRDVPPGAQRQVRNRDSVSARSRRVRNLSSRPSSRRMAGPTRAASHSCGSWSRRSDGQLRILDARDHHRALVALAADLGGAAEAVREPPAHHRSEPSADPFHGAPRYPGALSRLVRRRLLDRPESAAADGDLFLRLRHRAADAGSEPTRAAPASRSIFWPGCCRGWRFPNPWDARRT